MLRKGNWGNWMVQGAAALVLGLWTVVCAQAQGMQPGGGPMRGVMGMPGMGAVHGTVTAVQGNAITIQTDEGVTYTVQCSDSTHLMRRRQPIKITDVQVGDMLMAGGALDDSTHTLRAMFVGDMDAATVQKMRADLGKTWIAGKVTKIDINALQLTIDRIDHTAQTITVNENTSFRKDGQSVTLRDVHVGDFVRGRGSVQSGTFVPDKLNITDTQRMGHWTHGMGPGGPMSGAAPGSGQSAPAPSPQP
jgi:preprotein translocase subunit YajC